MKKTTSLKKLLLSAVIAVAFLCTTVFAFFFLYLPQTTNHGETIVVPNLIKSHVDELESKVIKRQLRYEINDSAYAEDLPPLTILKQFPEAGSRVKENRKIFLSVNSLTPPSVPVPQLIEGTLKNAQLLIKANDLKIEKWNWVPHIGHNTVRKVYYNGKPIEAGTRIPKGSKLTLDVGDGGRNGLIIMSQIVDNIYGTPFEDSKYLLLGSGLELGKLRNLGDSSNAPGFIYKVSHKRDTVRMGTHIDLWIVPQYDSTKFEEYEQRFMALEFQKNQMDSTANEQD